MPSERSGEEQGASAPVPSQLAHRLCSHDLLSSVLWPSCRQIFQLCHSQSDKGSSCKAAMPLVGAGRLCMFALHANAPVTHSGQLQCCLA